MIHAHVALVKNTNNVVVNKRQPDGCLLTLMEVLWKNMKLLNITMILQIELVN